MEGDANGARRSIDLETPTGRAETAGNVPLIELNTNLSIKIHRVGQKYMRNLKYKKPQSSPFPRPRCPISNQDHLVYYLVLFRPFVSSDGLAIIRDVVYPEPAIEAHVSVGGIRPNRTSTSRSQEFGTVRHDTHPPPPKHIQIPFMRRQLSVTVTMTWSGGGNYDVWGWRTMAMAVGDHLHFPISASSTVVALQGVH